MPCETQRRPNQTFTERKIEVRDAIAKLGTLLATGRAKAVVGPTGGIAFKGWEDNDRARVSDVCAYRMILVAGSALAKVAITKAETLAGRAVSREAIAHGHHMHGDHWHTHKG